jgi:hypothetical protein
MEQTLTIKTTALGDLYINGEYYRQLCFDAEQIGDAIADFINGVPADNAE